MGPLIQAAHANVRLMVDPRDYQLFELHTRQRWSLVQIFTVLRVNPIQVFLAKRRVSKRLRREIKRLEAEHAPSAQGTPTAGRLSG
jgi:hypothetical protein